MHLRCSVHCIECTRDVHKPLRQRKLKGTWKRYILHDMHITFISRNEYFFAMICTFVEHVNCFSIKHMFLPLCTCTRSRTNVCVCHKCFVLRETLIQPQTQTEQANVNKESRVRF